jgi:hypothetical protein
MTQSEKAPRTYTEDQLARRRARQKQRRSTEEYKAARRESRRQRYEQDVEYREAVKARMRNENLSEARVAAKRKANLRNYEKNSEALRQYQRDYRAALTQEEKSAICEKKKLARHKRVAANPVANSDRQRVNRLRQKYQMTEAEWWELFDRQGCACAICKEPEPGGKGWHVDHCHDTGAVRGILCMRCNTGIGMLRDSPAIVRRAVDYLEQSLLGVANAA